MSFKRVLNLKNIVNINNTSRNALKRTPLQNRLKFYYSTTPTTPDVAFEAPKDIKVSLDVNIGQPHYLTHPHLIQPNEITVGIPNLEYQLRRQKLVNSLPKGSAVVCIGNNLQFKDHNIFHQFHQNPNLLYLTGFNQPDGAMILEPDSSNHKGYKMTLLVSPKDPKVELWEGAKCGLDNAVSVFEADEAINIKEFTSAIKNIFKEYDTVFLDLPHDVIMHSKEHSLQNMIFNEKWQSKVKKLKPLLDDLRVVKSKYESDLIRTAGKIAGRSFVSTMRFTADRMRLNPTESVKNRLTEHDVANHFEYNCRLQGSQGNSFVPVVAGGNHALSLHYVANDALINNGDMIMMDAGAFYHGYGSDVTRSWPINGKFTEPQRNLYQAVLNVQKKCIKMCTVKEDISLNEILLRSLDLMLEELHKIGIHCSYKTLQNQLYPHHISHYLGLGIHDTPSVSRTRKLVPGMVVTIEPGIYIPYDNQFPKEYQGIGIRIEDDVLVTDLEEPIVLSAEAPKEIADIEYVCSPDTDLHLNL